MSILYKSHSTFDEFLPCVASQAIHSLPTFPADTGDAGGAAGCPALVSVEALSFGLRSLL